MVQLFNLTTKKSALLKTVKLRNSCWTLFKRYEILLPQEFYSEQQKISNSAR